MSRYQNDLYQLNNQLLLQIKLELDSLVTLHEQIFRVYQKARYDVTQLDYEVDNPQKKNLMDAFQQELIKTHIRRNILIAI